jgi:hypothetical protein
MTQELCTKILPSINRVYQYRAIKWHYRNFAIFANFASGKNTKYGKVEIN